MKFLHYTKNNIMKYLLKLTEYKLKTGMCLRTGKRSNFLLYTTKNNRKVYEREKFGVSSRYAREHLIFCVCLRIQIPKFQNTYSYPYAGPPRCGPELRDL